MKIQIRRVYEKPGRCDGKRILVDRLWPRGLSKEQAAVDEWMKEIAPSNGLRKWFAHRADRWEAFRSAYLEELEQHRGQLERLREMGKNNTITLVYAARDEQHNNAVVIRQWLAGNW